MNNYREFDLKLTSVTRLSKLYETDKSIVNGLMTWFGLDETVKILQMKPNDLMRSIRVNLLKLTRHEAIQRLKKEGIIAEILDKLPESLLVIKGWKKIGHCQSYLNGEIMPQGFGSMLAVIALDPQPGEKILDMAAAPGGKTCFIGERMKNEGILYANDKSRKRINSLVNNLARHSIQNTIITVQDALRISGKYDRILLDAPCSGDGLIISNPSRRKSKSIMNSYQLQKVQISLLKKAISLLKIGGICVYATCSLSPIENEEVIESVLSQVVIQKLNIQGDHGNDKLHPSLINTKRLIPSKYRCDGFFIAKLRRIN